MEWELSCLENVSIFQAVIKQIFSILRVEFCSALETFHSSVN